MAAATVNYVNYGYSGNRRMLSANLNAANTNTWATGLGMIDSVAVTGSATATTPAVTVSGGTLTFALGASDAALQVIVVGV